MEVKYDQLLLIDVTFFLQHDLKVVLGGLIKNEKPNMIGTGGSSVKPPLHCTLLNREWATNCGRFGGKE